MTCAGHHFRPEFSLNIRFIVGKLWNKCPMLFFSATMNRISMHHIPLMLHPKFRIKSMKDLSLDVGLDDTTLQILTIDPLPSKLLTALIWGQVGREGIDFVVDYNCNWVNSITVPLLEYT